MKAYKSDIMSLSRDMGIVAFEVDDLEDIGATWLNKYRMIIPPKTTGRRVTSLRALGRALGSPILAQYNAPTAATPQPHPLPGGAADLERMLERCNTEEQQALVTLCGLVGVRVSEARSTKPADFDFANRKLRIFGKGARERIVPVSDKAWSILLPIVIGCITDPNLPIVRMCDRSARDVITKLGARAGVPGRVSSHDLRATFATEAYRKTKDIRAVQLLLGHAGSKQTELYILVDDDSMSKAANFMEN